MPEINSPNEIESAPHLQRSEIYIQPANHPLFRTPEENNRLIKAFASGDWKKYHAWEDVIAQRIKKHNPRVLTPDSLNPVLLDKRAVWFALPAEPHEFTKQSPLLVLLGDPVFQTGFHSDIQKYASLTKNIMNKTDEVLTFNDLSPYLDTNLPEYGVNLAGSIILLAYLAAKLEQKKDTPIKDRDEGSRITRKRFLKLAVAAGAFAMLSQVAKGGLIASASSSASDSLTQTLLRIEQSIPSIPINEGNFTNVRTAFLFEKTLEIGTIPAEIIVGAGHGPHSQDIVASSKLRSEMIYAFTQGKIQELHQVLAGETPETIQLATSYLIDLLCLMRTAEVRDPLSFGRTDYPYSNPAALIERCVSFRDYILSRNLLKIIGPLKS